MHDLPPLSVTLAQLQKEGYTEDFNLRESHPADQRAAIQLSPEEFTVDKYFRFEGNSDPNDEAIVYAISARHGNRKGTLVNGYGLSSDAGTDELVRALGQKTA